MMGRKPFPLNDLNGAAQQRKGMNDSLLAGRVAAARPLSESRWLDRANVPYRLVSIKAILAKIKAYSKHTSGRLEAHSSVIIGCQSSTP